jgi:hypothetical protein
MLTTKEPRLMWAWVCPITGMVLDEAWGATEPYAKSKSERFWGKRRTEQGDMRLCRVTVEPLSADETAIAREEYAAWKAQKHQAEEHPAA